MEEGRYSFKILIRKPTGNRPIGRPRGRWEDSIKIVINEIGVNMRSWIDSVQDRNYFGKIMNAASKLSSKK
jgi:hypothetical protein